MRRKTIIFTIVILILSISLLYAEKVCPKCGRVYNDNVKYCPEDGTKLIAKAEYEKKKEGMNKNIKGDISILDEKPDIVIKDEIYFKRMDEEQRGDSVYFEYDMPINGYAVVRYRIKKGKWHYIKNKVLFGEINRTVKKGRREFVWLYLKTFPKGQAFGDISVEIDVWDGIVTSTGAILKYLSTNSKGYKEFRNRKDGSILIYIPAGEFTMGSNDDGDEYSVHKVYLDGYYISKYEITNKQYKKFCDETGHSYPDDPKFDGMNNYFINYPNYPVVNVSWNDAVAYCKWAGLKLPTEAEWEKANRGTDGRKYPWGNHNPYYNGKYYINYNHGDYTEDGYKYTSPVGHYPQGQSPYGAMDMAGNVWEWCNDWYDKNYYSRSSYKNPTGPDSGEYRVVRGGSWHDLGGLIHSTIRYGFIETFRVNFLGFRPSIK